MSVVTKVYMSAFEIYVWKYLFCNLSCVHTTQSKEHTLTSSTNFRQSPEWSSRWLPRTRKNGVVHECMLSSETGYRLHVRRLSSIWRLIANTKIVLLDTSRSQGRDRKWTKISEKGLNTNSVWWGIKNLKGDTPFFNKLISSHFNSKWKIVYQNYLRLYQCLTAYIYYKTHWRHPQLLPLFPYLNNFNTYQPLHNIFHHILCPSSKSRPNIRKHIQMHATVLCAIPLNADVFHRHNILNTHIYISQQFHVLPLHFMVTCSIILPKDLRQCETQVLVTGPSCIA